MQLSVSKIKNHKQVTDISCVPMSVEFALKLLDLMPCDDFSLQSDPSKSGNSNWIHQGFKYPLTNPEIIFKREYMLSDNNSGDDNRGQYFMQNFYYKLFDTIDKELDQNRYVIISLKSGTNQWHMEVVFNKVSEQEYSTVTFYHNPPQYTAHLNQPLKELVRTMQGTDILTYKYI